jgi:predicted GNAT family acetyltransferase
MLTAFHREADPDDPLPACEELERAAGENRFLFWIGNGEPVSMAGIVRRLKRSAAIAGVHTPPKLRDRGYAGSAVAATVERVYAEGRNIACLYADLEIRPRTAATQKSDLLRSARPCTSTGVSKPPLET